MKLEGQRVLITGGSVGIGKALAAGFIARGAQVAVCARNPDTVAAAGASLGATPLVGDVADPADQRRLLDEARAALGGLGILVNNAGIQHNPDFVAGDAAEVADAAGREIAVNLTALVQLTALAMPLLKTQEEAAIVNVSSGLALHPKASAPVYCATKFAVHGFSRALRYQTENEAPHVRVLEVLPPLVDTAMTRGRGSGKISPGQVAKEALAALEKDRPEVYVGKVKLLKAVDRLSPGLAARILRDV